MKHADYVSDSDNSAKLRGMIATAKRALKLRQMYAMFGKTTTTKPVFSSAARVKGNRSAHQERTYPSTKRQRVDQWKSRMDMDIDIPSDDDSSRASEFSDNDVPALQNRFSDDSSDSTASGTSTATIYNSYANSNTVQRLPTLRCDDDT